jgi:hypothetical protein
VVIHHKGFVNGSAAMEWIYRNLTAPESIFVTGCSAGSIGSIMFAPYIINRYPTSRVVQFGDAEAYVFHRPVDLQTDWRAHDNFPSWIPGMAQIKPGDFTIAKFYSAVARFYPEYVFSQYNSAHDSVQQRYFYAILGTPTPGAWEAALAASHAEIHANVPNFRTYTDSGSGHCVTPRPDFYTREVNGVRLVDWVSDLARGEPVQDVHCTYCEGP